MIFYFGFITDSYGFIDNTDSRHNNPNLIKIT